MTEPKKTLWSTLDDAEKAEPDEGFEDEYDGPPIVVQLSPCDPGWSACFLGPAAMQPDNADADAKPSVPVIIRPICAWGLKNDGTVTAMVVHTEGTVSAADSAGFELLAVAAPGEDAKAIAQLVLEVRERRAIARDAGVS